MAHDIPHFWAVFSNEQSRFFRPQLAHNFLHYTGALKKRYGVNNSITLPFIHSKIIGYGCQLITRTIAKHNRDIELLRDFNKVV